MIQADLAQARLSLQELHLMANKAGSAEYQRRASALKDVAAAISRAEEALTARGHF
jgi:hypothetical protein